MTSAVRSSRFVASLLAALLVACSTPSGDGGGEEPTVVTAPAGPIGGAAVSVPAGATPDPSVVVVAQGTDVVDDGFEPVGPAVKLLPDGLAFAVPVAVTVPFDAARLPADATVEDLVALLRDDGTGAVEALAPSAVDAAAGLLRFETTHFSTAQAGAPRRGSCARDGRTCDDGDPCTTGDACTGGVCAGTPVVCDDGDPCNGVEACVGGGCSHPGGPDCDDANDCTADRCDSAAGGCVHDGAPHEGDACDDGDACTLDDRCRSGACAGAARSCDDENPCTMDACGADGSCTNTPSNLLTAICYTGPAATRYVGACRDGASACRDGRLFGPCTGQQRPTDETCNGADDDCDGFTDEDTADCTTFYADRDNDTFGADPRCLCGPQGDWTLVEGGDCDDTNPNVKPGVRDDCAREGDENCNGDDNEGDGCTWWYADLDRDGFGDPGAVCLCRAAAPFDATDGTDCDDASDQAHPGGTERCNGVDDDCDGETDELFGLLGLPCDSDDADLCLRGAYVCLPDGSGVHCPQSAESETDIRERCNHEDDDCDGLTDEGFELVQETCDGVDEDCDGLVDEDVPLVTDPARVTERGCNPKGVCGLPGGTRLRCQHGGWACEPVHPAYDPFFDGCDGFDNDCDGRTDEDVLTIGEPCDSPDDDDLCRDDVWACSPAGIFCQDRPGSPTCSEICAGGVDDDGDGQTDCADTECRYDWDCFYELSCTNGVDDDLDGMVDCGDPDCAGPPHCTVETGNCTDGFDNDRDGLTDCADWLDCVGTFVGGEFVCGHSEICDDVFDNDGDGLSDCNDPGCHFADNCKGAETRCQDGVDDDHDGATDCRDPGCWSVEPCIVPEPNCRNGVDEDNDGVTDCDDPGCARMNACSDGSERNACADGNDNDGDGRTDCDDAPDCDCSDACPGHSATNECKDCLDGIDNDGDGRTDCADNDCQNTFVGGRFVCSNNVGGNELSCDDRIDNDGDGRTDCADSGCRFDGRCREPEADCLNGIDDDHDGATDCWDVGCATVGLCGADEASCRDGVDDDGDGFTDCDDPACYIARWRECELPPWEYACNRGVDEDGDGLTDCADSDCWNDPICPPRSSETRCGDRFDEDRDGSTDCADSDCAQDAGCRGTAATETSCVDGIDNDGDGLTDCADRADCPTGTFDRRCGASEVSCTDRFDNDGDGFVDCADAQCATVAACAAGETDCRNGIDDDGDGATDCLDPGCSLAVCGGPEADCGDGLDDDGDGAVDCRDPGCRTADFCLGGETHCENGLDDDRDGATDCFDADCEFHSACLPGGETACADGQDDDGDGRTDCADYDCRSAPNCSGLEMNCTNGVDDDHDGRTDCADSDCEWQPCDDGDPCTERDFCKVAGCDPGEPPSCDDGDPCTTDACQAPAGCVHTAAPDGTACDDGSDCTAGDTCAAGACQGGAPAACGDGTPETSCTNGVDDDHDGATDCQDRGCLWQSCSDGDACTILDLCGDGACSGALALSCNDDNPCTTDTCDPQLGCRHTALVDGTVCDDGSLCTAGETCRAGACTPATSVSCDDGDACTADTCDRSTGTCAHPAVADGTACDDGDACTTGDACVAGGCVAAPKDCDDANPCTDDGCGAGGACTHAPLTLVTVFCYGGPAGTRQVGACRDGSVVCANGQPSGACTGDQRPVAETCNAIDDDCDGLTDEDTPGCTTYYADRDNDGFGGDPRCFCAPQGDWRLVEGGDCDDANPNVKPGARDDCATAWDDDCDGDANEGIGCTDWHADQDRDGFGAAGAVCVCQPVAPFDATDGDDCDDANPAIKPGAAETCNGRDDDCDGQTDEAFALLGRPCDSDDADFCPTGAWTCRPDGTGVECPRASEVETDLRERCNRLDDDCDGLTDEGFELVQETCDGVDEDCDGLVDEDVPTVNDPQRVAERGCTTAGVCGLAGGMRLRCQHGGWGCEPAHAAWDPFFDGCDGLDNDCDGATDEDALTVGEPCDSPDDADLCRDDVWACDATGLVCPDRPGSPTCSEICTGGQDDDGDGQTDCADTECLYDPACNWELSCTNGNDDDLDGLIDCADPDCFGLAGCTDETAHCLDGLDNDRDGRTDCADVDCGGTTVRGKLVCWVNERDRCGDGIDNDGDGRTDCVDAYCAIDPRCSGVESDCQNGRDDDGDGATDCWDPGCAANVPPCRTRETLCHDGVDNDNDGTTDCDDNGCVSSGACGLYGPSVETACDDGWDEDGDGRADCEDADCTCFAACRALRPPTSECADQCTDGLDNDGDGQTDCADALDCGGVTQIAGRCAPTEIGLCGDGLDNDGDGRTDCADFRCRADGRCAAPEGNCQNGLDDDGDGATDCWDPGCEQVGACRTVEPNCRNGVDEDGDGFTDCADPGCYNYAPCACEDVPHECVCDDGGDEDNDGLVDCADPDCWSRRSCPPAPRETQCGDRVDEDRDGATDCLDSDCAEDAGCHGAAASEGPCDDGVDNDGDGLTDCADRTDCPTGRPGRRCGPSEVDCGDGFDNDGDGLVDCADRACAAATNCRVPEASCSNGLDDDLDGAVDCAEQDCFGDGFCFDSREERCKDGVDDDHDGATDCADPACFGTPECASGVEAFCFNEIDDDADGATDCDDSDCANRWPCLGPPERSCEGGVDEDGDGFTDCADHDCLGDAACVARERDCANGQDDDGDGLTDCADTDCAGAACSDGDACTAGELCLTGACRGGEARVCDDGDACTEDGCAPATGCTTAPISCDDGNRCTTDTCAPASGCAWTPVACPGDGNACTDEVCDGELGCLSRSTVCDDGDACTTDGCDPASGCTTAPRVCDDGEPCTVDGCDRASGCTTAPRVCNDGDPCTDDACTPGVGCGTTPAVCDDGDPCTEDFCLQGFGCGASPLPDGTRCAGDGVCQGGVCAPDCSPKACCTPSAEPGCAADPDIEACVCLRLNNCCTSGPGNGWRGGCVALAAECGAGPCGDCCAPSAAPGCVDFDLADCVCAFRPECCTDQWHDGCVDMGVAVCGLVCGGPVGCDDDDPCTADTCDAATGLCVHEVVADGTACRDDDRCTTGETCQGGVCAGETLTCSSDDDPCTDDVCNPETGRCGVPAAYGVACTAGFGTAGACVDGTCFAEAAGCTYHCGTDGEAPDMVGVPAGSFARGCNAALGEPCDEAAQPYREIDVGAFAIDRFEATVADWIACENAGSCGPGPDVPWCNYGAGLGTDVPMDCLDWYTAQALCWWQGKDLCTEAMWEKAARGGCERYGDCGAESARYPWGNDPASCAFAVMQDASGAGCGTVAAWPVGSRPAGASPYGALDMSGNVREWVFDRFGATYYAVSPDANPAGPREGTLRVVRGGEWRTTAAQTGLRVSDRETFDPWTANYPIGVRCCVVVHPGP